MHLSRKDYWRIIYHIVKHTDHKKSSYSKRKTMVVLQRYSQTTKSSLCHLQWLWKSADSNWRLWKRSRNVVNYENYQSRTLWICLQSRRFDKWNFKAASSVSRFRCSRNIRRIYGERTGRHWTEIQALRTDENEWQRLASVQKDHQLSHMQQRAR